MMQNFAEELHKIFHDASLICYETSCYAPKRSSLHHILTSECSHHF